MFAKLSLGNLNHDSTSTYTCLSLQKYVFPHCHTHVNYLDIMKQKSHVRKSLQPHNHLEKN